MAPQKEVEAAVQELLLALGEDPSREGLRDTPKVCSHTAAGAQRLPLEEAGQWLTLPPDSHSVRCLRHVFHRRSSAPPLHAASCKGSPLRPQGI